MTQKDDTEIVIVTGLPRSGTSMVMAMLQAGGMPILADDTRPADEHNPNGYFEYAPARAFDRDQHWLAQATGKAVKLISFHLFNAPTQFTYAVLFLRRPLNEILASQRAMLDRAGLPSAADDTETERLYEAHLAHVHAWLAEQQNMRVLTVAYHRAVHEPLDTTSKVDTFLGGRLDAAAMATTINPSLYRQRG